VEILQHHLAKDGAPAITPARQTETAVVVAESKSSQDRPRRQRLEPAGQLPPDKIIVYSYFPSSFELIKVVSHDRFVFQKMWAAMN
jgi:hypothetical protein